MRNKWKRIVSLVIITMFIFVGTFGIVANAEKMDAKGNNASAQVDRDRSQDREQKKEMDWKDEPNHQYCTCDITINCDQLQNRDQKRDRDCSENCECVNDCTEDRIRLRTHYNEEIEAIIELLNLEMALVEAEKNRNNEAIEELIPQLERARLRIREMVQTMNQLLESQL